MNFLAPSLGRSSPLRVWLWSLTGARSHRQESPIPPPVRSQKPGWIPWLGLWQSSLEHLFSSRTSRWNRQRAAAALSLRGLIKTVGPGQLDPLGSVTRAPVWGTFPLRVPGSTGDILDGTLSSVTGFHMSVPKHKHLWSPFV